MPDDKDNVVAFKQKAKEQPNAEQAAKDAIKKEMMERLIEGGRQLRLNNIHQHVVYYGLLFIALVVVVTLFAINIIG